MEIIQVLSTMVALFSGVLTMGKPGLNWFQAQDICKGSGLTTETTGMGKKEYWTGRYTRLSPWIKIIGCYPDSNITKHNPQYEAIMDTKSVGACQDICKNKNSSTFALKWDKCTCLKGQVNFEAMSKFPPSLCNYSCDSIDGIYSGECGGQTTQNVYLSDQDTRPIGDKNCMLLQCSKNDKRFINETCSQPYPKSCQNPDASREEKSRAWNISMEDCKKFNVSSYLYGDLDIQNATGSCQIFSTGNYVVHWVGIARQSYVKVDQGRKIEDTEKNYFLLCQKCNGANCTFSNCNDKIQTKTAECSERLTTKDTITNISFPQSTILHHSLISNEMVTSTSSTDSTDEKDTRTSQQSTATSSNEQISTINGSLTTSGDHQISVESSPSSMTITLQVNSSSRVPLSSKDNGKDDAIISVPIILGMLTAIIIVLTVLYLRRRNLRRKMDDNKNPPKLNGISNGTYPEVSDQQSDSYFVIEKPSSYEMADNCVIDPESPYIETEEGEYDHLRNKDSRKKDTNDTYQHVSHVSTEIVSNYDSTTAFQKGSKINKSKHEKPPQLESINSTYSEVDNPSKDAYFVLEKASSYELADNSVLDSESPYNETEEGDYDHLRNKNSRKEDTDDTYHHATFDTNRDMSDYDTSAADQTQELENTYDHMHESLNLHSDSDYGYNSIDPNLKH